ncbi:hypothetical protein BJX63DRAFT_407683 [Aspergillus granulosus]|uniref:Uncharacterized protein n=1 Tax=Aspergillus granulosus TaxID=176169 RepID=A0ABR4H062_9EURO
MVATTLMNPGHEGFTWVDYTVLICDESALGNGHHAYARLLCGKLGEVTGTTDKSSRKDGSEYDEDDSELPWEGIESTVEVTGGSRRN